MATLEAPLLDVDWRLSLLRTVGMGVWSCPEKGYSALLPDGFYFDGSSVPKGGWALLHTNWIQMIWPGGWHDLLCRREAKVIWHSPELAKELDYRLAIEIMEDVMEHVGVDEHDRERVKLALIVSAPFYWQKKPVDWDGRAAPTF